MIDTLQWLADNLPALIQEHWLKVVGALALTLLTSCWGIVKAWRAWSSRNDYDIMHISQNTFEERPTGNNDALEQWLILDVHSENQLCDDIEHPIPRWLIKRAAKKTTEDNVLLAFSEKDRWYVLNTVRMKIAEQFLQGTAAKLTKQATVEVVECVFALTYERYPDMRSGKIRVMIVKKDVLEDETFFDQDFRFESVSHCDRITTLRAMQKDFLRGDLAKHCMTVRMNIQI